MSNAPAACVAIEARSIALRCYADSGAFPASPRKQSQLSPSQWTVVFDTETEIDAAQSLRFGTYQVRNGDRLHEAGIFRDTKNLSEAGISLLQSVASSRNFVIRSTADFIENVLLKYGYDREGTIVGFNLPFDIARIAIRHGSARGSMRGGFTFVLSDKPWHPRIQIKHLNSRSALVRFTVPGKQRHGRGMRRRGLRTLPNRGYFVDVRTLAAALTSGSHSLASLGDLLRTEHRKLETDQHGGPLTEEYIRYAIHDVQVTWECYRELRDRYHSHKLTQTPLYTIKSEAGIGKAYLRQMGILPFRRAQPDFPPSLLGIIMSTYFGGRSEVHIRRQITRVLYCDFLSMYPTVCTLMGLWRFVISNGVTWHDSTVETRDFLGSLSICDLKHCNYWAKLTKLVRVRPEADIFPVRASYAGEQQNTIGLNYLTNGNGQWFTLADCIASKLLTGRTPKILEAITFVPKELQAGLQSVAIAGHNSYRINPTENDFYRRLIDLRSNVKRQLKRAKQVGRADEVIRLESEQLALKILANATSYGIFMEINVEDLDKQQTVQCHGTNDQPFPVQVKKRERLGTYFHPLLATLITGAARLMLAIAERLARDTGLDRAFCDTDSIALARPDDMDEPEFLTRAETVRGWFDALNPYKAKGELLKLEDANVALHGSGRIEQLFCFAVSAKRYALFNLDAAGRPVIRKASAHGLGHLMPPYDEAGAPAAIPRPSVPLVEIGLERWQYDLWYQIVSAALAGHPERPDLDYHPALNQPAISRYGATTPELLRWFDTYNQNRPYVDQVRPFGFMTALHARNAPASAGADQDAPSGTRRRQRVRPIAPYHKEPAGAAAAAFDRETGAPVPLDRLATYRQVLAQYHLHPEAKFLHGDFTDRGPTQRRHIQAIGITYIGKEANRWEAQFFLGTDEDAVVSYGPAPQGREEVEERVRRGIRRFGQKAIAPAARMSLREVNQAAREPKKLSLTILDRLDRTLAWLGETSAFPR